MLSRSLRSLTELATKLLKDGPVKTGVSPRRVRVQFGGEYIADSLNPAYVWEHKYFPQYYFKLDQVKKVRWGNDIIEGKACLGTVDVDGKSSDRVILFKDGPLKDLVRIEFAAMGELSCRLIR